MFKDKTLLITGGTGSFGNAVLKRFLNTPFVNILALSESTLHVANAQHEPQTP